MEIRFYRVLHAGAVQRLKVEEWIKYSLDRRVSYLSKSENCSYDQILMIVDFFFLCASTSLNFLHFPECQTALVLALWGYFLLSKILWIFFCDVWTSATWWFPLFFWSVFCKKCFSFWDFQASWRSYSLVCDVRSRLVSSYWPHGPFSVLLFSKSVKTLLGGMKPFFQKIFPYLGPKSPQVFSWDLVTVKA